MRVLVKASMTTEAGNRLSRNGTLGSVMKSILEDLKPEAVYFGAENGKRTAYLFVNVQDASEIPGIAEPLFLAFDADIDFIPVMTPADLAAAGPGIEKAAKKYGATGR
jgi:hypothetical protein